MGPGFAGPVRRAFTVTAMALALLVLLQSSAACAWLLRRSAANGHHLSFNIRRADQLARAALAEAFAAVQQAANDPRVPSGKEPTELLGSWFRLLRPPVSASSPPVAPPAGVSIQTPDAVRLAGEEGFTLGSVIARRLALEAYSGVWQGVLECSVEITGGRGPTRIQRRIVERRVFFDLDATTVETPSSTLLVQILTHPMGRSHASL
jgi:hypothetical protein